MSVNRVLSFFRYRCQFKYLPLICVAFLFLFFLAQPVMAEQQWQHQSLHDVYLANTEHELHVFRIYGKEPGKTLMLIGGIQGDEPGGYLTADLYADISLKKGNLIVVPRANFYSILLNQRNGLTGDMNRKFAENKENQMDMELEIVSILKKLIGESDCLLNLHEGSGFFSPVWVDEMENPNRFGQSIIYDSAQYFAEKTQQNLDLEALANRVISEVNRQIPNKRFQFRANNHNTVSTTTSHPEQRKSATYYALTQANIPAFGVETSKSIRSNREKVQYHKLVVNAFMKQFGIIPDTPGDHVEKPEINYILVRVNGGVPYAVPNQSKIIIRQGDEVVITDVIANFNRGLTADFLGLGSYNDTRLPFRLAKSVKVVIRKDAEQCGFVEIEVVQPESEQKAIHNKQPVKNTTPARSAKPTLSELKAEKILINVGGQILTLLEGKELSVPANKAMIIKAVQSNISRLDPDIKANLKGFAPPKRKNDGNDINFPVYPKHLWKRFSENRAGKRYPIEATYKDKPIGTFWIKVIR